MAWHGKAKRIPIREPIGLNLYALRTSGVAIVMGERVALVICTQEDKWTNHTQVLAVNETGARVTFQARQLVQTFNIRAEAKLSAEIVGSGDR